LSPLIYNKIWTHLFEEDKGKEKKYKPGDSDFPLARRVRESFEVRQDGEFIFYTPGPDDRPQKKVGRYTIEGNNTIKADIQGKKFVIDTSSVEQNELRVIDP
jgi:hypothetical protein